MKRGCKNYSDSLEKQFEHNRDYILSYLMVDIIIKLLNSLIL